ncbi:MAG: outer membrane protein assembly factor BamD [Desulfarculales bacterium]|jgi:tol-pal system protein YbgF|nr:outer membrane protein assembly factor BamD [Desulfarculales bacterium]
MPYIIILLLAAWLLLPACAPGNNEAQQRLLTMQAQLDNQAQVMQEMARRLELATHSLEQNRGPQAALSNDLTNLRQSVAQMTGRLEETQQRLSSVQSADPFPQINDLSARISYLERYLGITSHPPAAANPGAGAPAGNPAAVNTQPAAQSNSDPKTIYQAGMRLYQQKSFPAARDRFEELLRSFPNSPYSEAAQFQLGETLYADQKYQDAILAYQQLINQYEKSKNILAAKLRQAISFAALGDKNTARIIYNQLVKDFPDSPEAQEAKDLLSKLP